jgi:hypothetical protein
MKIMQIVYPGLGGTSAIAFSLVEGQKKNKEIKNFFLFCGVENLISIYKKKCLNSNIKYFFLKKNRFQIHISKILNILRNNEPDVLIVHDYNLLPFYLYKITKKIKLIYVHHTPDKTKKIKDWILYLLNSTLSDNTVLVSRRNKNDFMYKLNKIFFSKKIKIIENGINTQKFKK